MRIKETIEKVPGGLMVVPLMLGARLNTIDQAHLAPIEAVLKALGATPVTVDGQAHYEFLRIGGFQALGEPATAQISISTLTTAVLCPLAVIAWVRFQQKRGIDGRVEQT